MAIWKRGEGVGRAGGAVLGRVCSGLRETFFAATISISSSAGRFLARAAELDWVR